MTQGDDMRVDTEGADVPPPHPSVLVIGGGPIGLTTFIGLRRAGVDAVLIEKHETTARIPKALLLNQRTMEVFRQLGLEDDVRDASLPWAEVGYLFHAESLTSDVYERVPMGMDSDKSAVSSCLCSQDALEPVLRAHADRLAPGRVLFGTRAESLRQDAEGVDVGLIDTPSGAERSLRASYVVAADGAHSSVREMLGIQMRGEPSFGHAVHVVFDAPIGRHVSDRASAMYYVKGDLLFVIVDGDTRWRLMVNQYDPEIDGELGEERALELIRRGVGLEDLEVEIQGIFPWQPSALLADAFRAGRVLLAGDAAHVRPPWGGLGMNAGIGDAHNVAWKLGEVLGGRAGEQLLETYEEERRPIAQQTIEAAIRNSGQAAKVSSPDPAVREAAARNRRAEGLILGYTYASAGIISEDGRPAVVTASAAAEEYVPTADPGHRAPHFWVEDGRSVTDLFGDAFVLLTGRQGRAWSVVADDLANDEGIALRSYVLGPGGDLTDPSDGWRQLYGQGPDGAVLVRPDGHVAWRCQSLPDSPSAVLREVLHAVLGRASVHAGRLA